MPSAATGMDLDIVILSEVRQDKEKYDVVYLWDLKKIIHVNLVTKQKHSHT